MDLFKKKKTNVKVEHHNLDWDKKFHEGRIFVNPYNKHIKQGPLWRRSFHFPLYFGWEIVFTLQKIADKTKQIVGPFRTYKAYMTAVVLLIFVFGSAFFISNQTRTDAATYNFIQTDWSIGVTGNPATHTDNRTDWNEYSAKDSNISAGTEIVLAETITTATETSDTDFNAGTTSTTTVLGSGDSASVSLGTSEFEGLTSSADYYGLHDITYDSSTDSVWVIRNNNNQVSKISATAGNVIGTYDVGINPLAIAFDSSTNSIWVTSFTSDTVTKLSAADGSLTGIYSVGDQPKAIAFDSSTNSIWVVNTNADTVTKLLADDGSLTGTYDVGDWPRGVAFDSSTNSIWVANANDATVTKLLAADGSLTGTYSVGIVPRGVAFDSSTNSIWVANAGANTVTKLLAADGSLTGTYATVGGPYDVAFDPSTNSIWVTGNTGDQIRKIQASDGATLTTKFVGEEPSGITFDTTNNKIWLVQGHGYSVARYNTSGEIDLFSRQALTGISFSSDNAFDSYNNFIWLSDGGSGQTDTIQIDASDGSIDNTYTDGGNGPTDVIFETITNSVWISDYYGNTVTKRSVVDGSLTGTYAMGNRPKGMTFDPSTNSVWVTMRDDNTISKLSVSDASITGTYDVGTRPVHAIFEATTNSIWVANNTGNSVTKLSAADGSVTGTYGSCVTAEELAFDPVNDLIWATCRGSNYIRKYNVSDGSSAGTISINVPWDIEYDAVTQSMWVTMNAYNTILKIDVNSDVIVGQYATVASSRGISFDSSSNAIWLGGFQYDEIIKIPLYTYTSSGTFTSQTIDTTANSSFVNMSWNATTPTNTALTMKVRSDTSSNMSGATAWGTCNTVTSGNDISDNNCVTDGHRYIQYQASLTSSDSSVSPQLQDASIQYNSYSNGSLLSSAFDSEDSTNAMGTISWTESGTGDVQLQVRTAPDSGDSPDWANGSGWCGPNNCASTTGDTDYAASYYTSSGVSLHSDQSSGANDQWYQYRLWLTSADGLTTPTFSDITIAYVVNAPPEFETTVTASQGSNGLVTIDYSVRDTDTTSGSTTPGFITPSFQYSINGGNDWFDITAGLPASATTQKAVDQVNYTDYQVIWTAKDQLDGTNTTQAQIRISITDSELTNFSDVSTSADYALDVKDPALGTYPIVVDSLVSPADLSLDTTDDNAIQMKISLNSDLSGASWEAYNSSSTLSLATDPDTIYVQFVDALSNSTTIQSVVTPETPDNIIIRDLSNPDTDDWQFFVSWGSVSIPVDDFTFYRVWHSTDGTNYTLQTSISDRSTNYYLQTGLTQDSAHHYKISTERDDGSKSYYSTVVTDVADGQGGTDSTSPDLSNVTISSINTQSALVTWDTGELSDSTVGYSTTAGVFTTEVGSPEMVDSEGNYGPHEIVLTGLTPGTKYYIQVTSEDPSGNTTSDSDGGDGYSFTTLSGPSISNVTTTSISNTKAAITWITDINSNSIVYYSTNSDMSNALAVTDETATTVHELIITSLSPGTKYYYYIQSGVAIDNNSNNYYLLNTTLDNTNPTISAVAASPITDTQSVIQWLTNEIATSQVDYGTTSGDYSETTTLDENMNITHSITLNNLTANTTYYYQVTSSDASDNSSSSIEKSFITLETLSEESTVEGREDLAREEGRAEADTTTPTISEVVVSDITSNSTKINWTTNEETNSFIQFGLTDEYEKIYGNWVYQTTHEILLRGLLPQSEYHYRIISVDKGENMITTEDETFTTILISGNEEANEATLDDILNVNSDLLAQLAPQISIDLLEASLSEQNKIIRQLSSLIPTPLISGVPLVTKTSSSASITWTTDKDANSLVAYSPDSVYTINNEGEKYSQVVGDSESFQKKHTVTISNLTPETTYHYQLRSRTEISDTTKSADYTFTTERKSFGIENYSVEKITNEKAIFSWVTTEKSNSILSYTPYRGNVLAVDEKSVITDNNLNLIHQVNIDTFESGVVYFIELTSTDENDNISVITIETFTTNEENTAPLITQVQTDSALSPGGKAKVQTIVSWRTNEPATSRIFFQQGVGDIDIATSESTQLDKNYTKDHVVIITTFESGSVYQFQVESTDSSGLVSLSSPITILTPQEEQTVFEVIFGAMEDAFGWLRVFNQ